MKSALEGIVIVDLSTGIAGPYAAMLLTDMGADCVKIEPREGDPARDLPGFLVWNRGKRALTLNLETDEGQEIIYRLAEKADVVIESFSPQQAKRLGVAYESLSRLNQRLIYCAIPLFGESGPLSEKPGNEGTILALAGIMADQGGYDEQEPPVFVTIPLGSYSAAFLATYAVSSALYVRETSSIGQKVEVSLLSGALAMESGFFVSGVNVVPIIKKGKIQQGTYPAFRLYQCQDEWILLGCGNQTFWNKFCIIVDRVDLVADPRFENCPWGVKDEYRDTLTDILAEIFRQKTRDYWLKLLGESDIPCAAVSRREEFMEDPQVKHNQMIVEVEDPQFGKTRQMGIPVTLVETPGRIKGPAPQLGEHTDAILRELGYTAEKIVQLRNKSII